MTRDQAIAIRTRQLQGESVLPAVLNAALEVIKNSKSNRVSTKAAKELAYERSPEGRQRADWLTIRWFEDVLGVGL